MEFVVIRDKRTALHIHSANDDAWVVGTSFTVDWEENRYFRGFGDGLRWTVGAADGGSPYRLRDAIEHMLAVKDTPEKYNAELAAVYPLDPWAALSDMHGVYWESLNYIREIRFEHVRATEFPQHPSRRQTIFLLPDDPKCLKYWWGGLGDKDQRIFRVVAEGRFHEGHDEFVKSDAFSITEWDERARLYWRGQGQHDNDIEWLFSGQLEIREVLRARDFGLAE